MSYYGIIDAETLRDVQDRIYTQLFKEQLAEIDEELKALIADDPTVTEVEFEFEEIYDETLAALQSAGYTTNVSGVEDDGTVILTISWDEEDDGGCNCNCDCC